MLNIVFERDFFVNVNSLIETTLVAQKKSCAVSSNSGLFRGEGEKKSMLSFPPRSCLPQYTLVFWQREASLLTTV